MIFISLIFVFVCLSFYDKYLIQERFGNFTELYDEIALQKKTKQKRYMDTIHALYF